MSTVSAASGLMVKWQAEAAERRHQRVIEQSAALEQAFRQFIPVEAFTRERHDPTPPVPVPEVGVRWGQKSEFDIEEASQNSLNKPPPQMPWVRYWYHLGTSESPGVRVVVDQTDLSPVWSEHEVRRIFLSRETEQGLTVIDPEDYIDVQNTLSMIVPLGTQKRSRVVGVQGNGFLIFENYDVEVFLKLNFPKTMQSNPRIGDIFEEGEHPMEDTETSFKRI